jgi:hypothetical protein
MPDNNYLKWIPAYPGHLSSGDKVRVVSDAFPGRAGAIHNGRIGEVVLAAEGDIIVRSVDGRTPALTRSRYPYYKLEKAV